MAWPSCRSRWRGRLSRGVGDAGSFRQDASPASCPCRSLQPEATKLAIKIPHLLAAPDWETQPGDEFMALWGTGYDEGRAFIEIEQRNKIIQRFWTKPGRPSNKSSSP